MWKNQAFGVTAEPIAIVYNKRLLPASQVPHTHADMVRRLRDSANLLAGRIATYDPERSSVGYLLLTQDLLVTDRTWSLIGAMGLAGVRLFASSGEMLDRVIAGDVVLAYNVIGSYALDRARNAPDLGVVLPSDYTLVMSRVALIPKGAPHPSAARLFLDYLLSASGQKALAARAIGPVRRDIGPDSAAVMPSEAARPIELGLRLLASLDQAKRARFMRDWQALVSKAAPLASFGFSRGRQLRDSKSRLLLRAHGPIRARISGERHASHGNALRGKAASIRGFSDVRGARPRRIGRGHQGSDRPRRFGLRQAGVQGRRREEGQGRTRRPRQRPQDRVAGEGAALFRRAPRRTTSSPRRTASPSKAQYRPSTRSISRSPIRRVFARPTMTLTHQGGVDIEELPRHLVAQVPFDPLTGLKAFVVANALTELKAPKPIISPLVQMLPKLWELFHNFGMTTLELNPIRMRPDGRGRLTPVACDFKCGFDRDDPRWQRLGLPAHLFAIDHSAFEQEINQLRTYQGQSDVYVINPAGTILAPTFGGGANSLVSELLGEDAIISSDFGGNPPYDKMKEVARICFDHWLRQANVLFIIGGKSNNTDIFETFPRHCRCAARAFQPQRPDADLRGRSAAAALTSSAAWPRCATPAKPWACPIASSVSTATSARSSPTHAPPMSWMKTAGRAEIAAKLGLGDRTLAHAA